MSDLPELRRVIADERFALVWQKVERANKHIGDLVAAIGAFDATKPYRVEVKRDPTTRKPVYFVSKIDAVPLDIPLILGDAIQNLRTALDHLAQQLYLVGTGSTDLASHTTFPIADTALKHEALVAKSAKGMTQEAIDAICALEPYKDGKGHQLWVLHKLNNIDKHRALVACAGSFQAFDIAAATLPTMLPSMRAAFEELKLTDFIRPKDMLCPLRVGHNLYIGGADEELNLNLSFVLGVALNEPDVVEPGWMLDAVQHLANVVGDPVKAFKPYLV
jgi:hypothetical protein